MANFKRSNRTNTQEETLQIAQKLNLNRYTALFEIRNNSGIEKKELQVKLEPKMSKAQGTDAISFAQKNSLISTRYDGERVTYTIKPANLNLLLEVLRNDEKISVSFMNHVITERSKELNGNQILALTRIYRGLIEEIAPVKEEQT